MKTLDEKVAIVLGASSTGGAGEAIARAYAKNGAKVIVSGRSSAPLQTLAESISGSSCECDITNEDDVRRLAEHAIAEYGRLDIAVNAAGQNFFSPLSKITADQLQQASAIHIVGTALFIKHMAAVMADGGSIITTSSTTALVPASGMAAYGASKAAADHIVRIAALEYGSKGIRINSIAPGLMKTPMTDGMFGAKALIGLFENETPLGKLASVENVAANCVWLASDDCISTGELHQVNGGAGLTRLPTPQEMQGAAD